MELSSPKIKKLLTFSQKNSSYLLGNRTFQAGTFRARKIKKTNSENISYILGNGTC